jgi:energy-coupling factor transport system permease protein
MLFELSNKNSSIHKLDPRTKLAVAVIFTISSFLLNSHTSLLVLLFLVVLYGIIGQLYPWDYKQIIYILIPFTIGITLFQILANVGSHPFPAVNLFGISIPLRGIERGIVISLRTFVLAISFGLFMMTTHPTDITQAAHRMGLPFKFAYMIGFGLRFIPLFREDFQKIRQAQVSRGMNENSFGPISVVASMPVLLVPLMMTSVRHAQMLAISLEMRGLSTANEFGRTYQKVIGIRIVDRIVMTIFVIGFLVLIAFRFTGLIL